MEIFVFISMIFCHILDDYVLQSCWLVNGKQKSWWEKNAPDRKYRYDYIAALICHSLSWSFMILLPIAIYYHFDVGVMFAYYFVANALVHATCDHAKANKHDINLIQDQISHLFQIIITFTAAIGWMGVK